MWSDMESHVSLKSLCKFTTLQPNVHVLGNQGMAQHMLEVQQSNGR